MKKSIGLFLFAFMIMLIFSSIIHAALLISELDCDTVGTDTAEFVEILNTGSEEYDFSVSPVVLVFFNGDDENNSSYRALGIEGTLNPGEVLVVGGPDVNPEPNQQMGSNFIQNGADAIALYSGFADDWPNGTVPKGQPIDALVYGTDDPDDKELLAFFYDQEDSQVDENFNDNRETDSIQRIEPGIGGSHFIVGPATPGESTLVPVPGAVYLLSSGLIALIWMRSRTKQECVVGAYRASHR